MDEREFEARLERLFNQPPAFDDNDAFARRVETKLNRNWRVRALSIAFAGSVGGLIALSQTLGSGFGLQVQQAGARSTERVNSVYDSLWDQAALQLANIGGVDLGMNLFWAASALLILAAGAATTRMFDQN